MAVSFVSLGQSTGFDIAFPEMLSMFNNIDPGVGLAMAAAATADTAALQNYIGTYRQKIFDELLNGLDLLNDVTVDRNVREERHLAKLIVNGGIRPYNTSIEDEKSQGRTFSKRTLTPRTGMKIIKVNVQDYRKIFLGEKVGPKAKREPFSAWMMRKEVEKLQSEINDNFYLSDYAGDAADYNPASTYSTGDTMIFTDNIIYKANQAVAAAETPITDPAKWDDYDSQAITTGFGTLIADEITATKITPVVTGSITSTNAYDKMKLVYRSRPDAMKNKNKKTKMWVSIDVLEKYVDSIEEDFEKGNVIGTNEADKGKIFLKGSAKKCEIVPCSWMGTSQRIIHGLPETLIAGVDQLGDANSISKLIETMHGFQAMFAYMLCCQISDLDTITVNDQA